ncbi:hypothetical protein [Aeropyrum camini]|uniref:hypothetical protein n=1 Tax=Aeropyrum camini TaxID=229980 RepID=UPI00078727D1|nr:hypothetical protein [Aeropyrum camini]
MMAVSLRGSSRFTSRRAPPNALPAVAGSVKLRLRIELAEPLLSRGTTLIVSASSSGLAAFISTVLTIYNAAATA